MKRVKVVRIEVVMKEMEMKRRMVKLLEVCLTPLMMMEWWCL